MAWRLLQDRLPTKSNLVKRNILPQSGDLNCPLCNSSPESAAYLFLECGKSIDIWYACFKWFGVDTVCHNQIEAHFNSFLGILDRKKGSLVAICGGIVKIM